MNVLRAMLACMLMPLFKHRYGIGPFLNEHQARVLARKSLTLAEAVLRESYKFQKRQPPTKRRTK